MNRITPKIIKREDLEKPKKVLLAAHDEKTHKVWVRDLEMRCPFGSIAIIHAFSIEDAEKKRAENPDIDVIVVEACLSGNFHETIPFVERLQDTFRGHVIFASNVMSYRHKINKQIEHHHTASVHSMHKRVIEVLELNHL